MSDALPPADSSKANAGAAGAGVTPGALPPGRWQGIIITAGVVLVVALVLGIWLDTRNQIGALQRELVQKLAASEQFNKDGRLLVDQMRETVRAVDLKVNTLESRFAETQNQRMALEALYTELSRSRDERVLAEIEQILLIANQQLQLARNVKAALVALDNADGRLQRSDSAPFTQIRRAIQADAERLKTAPFVDITGIGVRLDNISTQVDLWPLLMLERPPETRPGTAPGQAREGGVVQFLREFWQDARNLVRIHRLDHEPAPLLTPQQSFFLRENLKLRLLSARVNLSSQDETGYKSDLRQSVEWIDRYFDRADKKVVLARTTLSQLAQSPISIELPVINATIEAVRHEIAVRERGIR